MLKEAQKQNLVLIKPDRRVRPSQRSGGVRLQNPPVLHPCRKDEKSSCSNKQHRLERTSAEPLQATPDQWCSDMLERLWVTGGPNPPTPSARMMGRQRRSQEEAGPQQGGGAAAGCLLSCLSDWGRNFSSSSSVDSSCFTFQDSVRRREIWSDKVGVCLLLLGVCDKKILKSKKNDLNWVNFRVVAQNTEQQIKRNRIKSVKFYLKSVNPGVCLFVE